MIGFTHRTIRHWKRYAGRCRAGSGAFWSRARCDEVRRPSPSRWVAKALHALGASALLAVHGGCGPAEGRVVATDDVPVVTELARPRGRVSVVDGKLRTDVGSPLRGLLVPVDIGWTLDDFELIERIAKETGLN